MFPLSAAEKVWHWGKAMARTKSAPAPFATPLLVVFAGTLSTPGANAWAWLWGPA